MKNKNLALSVFFQSSLSEKNVKDKGNPATYY